MLTLIVARARNDAIGRDGDIPWHIPQDLAFFKRETLGGALIMGRRTWESLPVRPLKNRLNLVVSSTLDAPDHAVSDLDTAIRTAQRAGYARIYGIGGARIYRDLMPMADRLLISEVDMAVEDADTFFPRPEEGQWEKRSCMTLSTDEPACVVQEWLRKAPA
ncbi:dihydrofolate reductase [Paracoccus aerodenitrificans]|uniref:dihydrofolate reductase n=1 Tax=Paracoccus aerodenitrificans TaxID=3017781 RepID=UPI0022F12EB9|nr:dihydrofolate reductase [Paracoccus aerodenitrificans]WBU65007.1 dihydrofolate reductase [Paracoccus aerodenitrificans]